MIDPALSAVLDTALTSFVARGFAGTTIDQLTDELGLSHRRFYELVSNKATLIELVYAHVLTQLVPAAASQAQPGERVQTHLQRWWQLTAAAAQTHPRAFAFWGLYRTRPRSPTATPEAHLGPFAGVPALVRAALARPGAGPFSQTLPVDLLASLLAASWTATVEVVLSAAACQASPALRTRVLTHAFTSWWQGTGLPSTLRSGEALRPPAAPSLLAFAWQALAQSASAQSPPPGAALVP